MGNFKRSNKRSQTNGSGKGRNVGNSISRGATEKEEDRFGSKPRLPKSEGDFTSKENDPSWYAKNPQLLVNAGNLPYSHFTGSAINLGVVSGHKVEPFYVPGIMTMRLLTGPGSCKTDKDAFNLAVTSIYSFIRSANSGGKNYDREDLGVVLLAFDEIIMQINWAIRAYGLMTFVDPMNRYTPKDLVEASGFDYNSIQNNLPQFRYYINQAITRLTALYIPESFSYYTRHAWLYQGVYEDGISGRNQYYMFVPATSRTYDSTTGTLKHNPVMTALANMNLKVTIGTWFQNVTQMLDALLGDEDVAIICGDVLKAYGDSAMLRLPTMPDDYRVVPDHNTEVLNQIHNAVTMKGQTDGVNDVIDSTSIDITKDSAINHGWVVYRPILTSLSKKWYEADKILDMDLENPTAMDNMIATRLMAFPTENISTNVWELDIIGTEVAVCANYYVKDGYGNTNQYAFSQTANLINNEQIGHCFDSQPVYYLVNQTPDDEYYLTPIAHFNNYTVVNRDVLRGLHDVALLSEFNVPLR